jgi:hypothetical protein
MEIVSLSSLQNTEDPRADNLNGVEYRFSNFNSQNSLAPKIPGIVVAITQPSSSVYDLLSVTSDRLRFPTQLHSLGQLRIQYHQRAKATNMEPVHGGGSEGSQLAGIEELQ